MPDFASADFLLAAGDVLVAGLVRGFSGFGSAMVMMPVLSAIYGPAVAVPMGLLLELVNSTPLVPGAVRHVDWRQMSVLAATACLAIPLGAWILLSVDGATMRLAISGVVLSAVAMLAFGWRYHGRSGIGVTAATGFASGVLNGASGMGGPPVVFFYLSGPEAAVRVRASLIVYFALIDIVAVAIFAWQGTLGWQALERALLLAPPLLAGIFVGSRLFGKASERLYRRVALAVLTGIALGSLLL